MVRENRSDDELRGASNHLFYEYWMLRSLSHAMGSGMVSSGWIANAVLESFVIHVRGLMDFLYNDTPKADDVIAEDFFDDPDHWKSIRPEKSETLRTARRRAGKEIAHLTYARLEVSSDDKPWLFVPIADEIDTAMTRFLENVARERLGDKWKGHAGS